MLLMPDPNTAVVDPFRTHKTLNLNCFVRDPITLEPYSRDPRYVAQKAEAYLGTTGLADTCYFGPEAEFFIFNDVRYSQDQRAPSTRSTRSRGTGTRPRTKDRTWATRSGPRRGTSRCRRPTISRTCGRR
jgi:glutamine synthetase